jgi:hypothetical protein
MDGSNADCCHTHSFQIHNNLTGLDGGAAGGYYHLTQSQHDTLTDGSNADALHTHSGGGGTFDGVHNDLDGLQGGDISNDEMYHLTFDQIDIVSRFGEDSSGLTFDGETVGTGGGGVSIHNSLTGLQGGIDGEYYHLTENENNLVSRLGEDSSGLTFDNISMVDSLWTRTAGTLSPSNSGDNISTTGKITAETAELGSGNGAVKGTLELRGEHLTTSARGGHTKWFLDGASTIAGYTYANLNSQFVWDKTEQATYDDTGVAWIDFDDGSASFANSNFTIAADGDTTIAGDIDLSGTAPFISTTTVGELLTISTAVAGGTPTGGIHIKTGGAAAPSGDITIETGNSGAAGDIILKTDGDTALTIDGETQDLTVANLSTGYVYATAGLLSIASNSDILSRLDEDSAGLTLDGLPVGTDGYWDRDDGTGILTTATDGDDVDINGNLSAVTKSFLINHPVKEGYKLQYGSLESPYHGVRLTGRDFVRSGECKVYLPDYISKLVREEGVNIQITNINHSRVLYVKEISIKDNYFIISAKKEVFGNKEYEFFWAFTAVRKDIDMLAVEHIK